MDTSNFFLQNVGLSYKEPENPYHMAATSWPIYTWENYAYLSAMPTDVAPEETALDLVKYTKVKPETEDSKPLLEGEEAAKLREMAYVKLLKERWIPVMQRVVNKEIASKCGFKECANCKKNYDRKWRRDSSGRQLCNACGLYMKANGYDRPLYSVERRMVKSPYQRSDEKCCTNCFTSSSTSSSRKWRKVSPGGWMCGACCKTYEVTPQLAVTQEFARMSRQEHNGGFVSSSASSFLLERAI